MFQQWQRQSAVQITSLLVYGTCGGESLCFRRGRMDRCSIERHAAFEWLFSRERQMKKMVFIKSKKITSPKRAFSPTCEHYRGETWHDTHSRRLHRDHTSY